jgi:hypothetical protein
MPIAEYDALRMPAVVLDDVSGVVVTAETQREVICGSMHRDTRWHENIEKLKCFLNRYGHCCVPLLWAPDASLGNWVHNVRQLRRLGRVSEERIQQLDALGFAWNSQTRSKAWDSKLNELKSFKARYGHCGVFLAKTAARTSTARLRNWVRFQRHQMRLGKLSPERALQLDELGFIWNSRLSDWQRRLNELQEYKWRYGHCHVSTLSVTYARLANWVRCQRRARKLGKLSASQIQQLDQLGFTWQCNARSSGVTP